MKRIKSVEITKFRGQRYLRVWQYTARGGKSLAYQVRLPDGVKPSEAMKEPEIAAVLEADFGIKGL